MSITEGGPVPRIGDTVRMPSGATGTLRRVFNPPMLPLIYLVERDNGSRSIHLFDQLAIVSEKKQRRGVA